MPPTVRVPPGSKTRLMHAVADIAARLGDDEVEWGVGQQIFAEHGKPRRVTFVPTVGRIETSDRAGAVRILETAAVFVTDVDHGATEALFELVLAAAWQCSVAEIVAEDQDGTFEWYTERSGESGLMLRTPMILFELRIRFDAPVPTGGFGEVVIQAQQHDCKWVETLEPTPPFPPYQPP